MQSSKGSGAGLQGLQEASWSFPPDDALTTTAANKAPSITSPNEPAATTSLITENHADTMISSPQSLSHAESQNGNLVAIQSNPPATPTKTRKKTKKRKAVDSDSEYKTSTKKKKRNAPALATPKSKRKTADNYAEKDYKPSTKYVREQTLEDEIDDDPDICLDDCDEEDEQDMIHCDAEACRVGGKWFHTRCVGFEKDLPSNMEEFEWYCPTCRDELDVGLDTNGLIYRTTLGEDDEKVGC